MHLQYIQQLLKLQVNRVFLVGSTLRSRRNHTYCSIYYRQKEHNIADPIFWTCSYYQASPCPPWFRCFIEIHVVISKTINNVDVTAAQALSRPLYYVQLLIGSLYFFNHFICFRGDFIFEEKSLYYSLRNQYINALVFIMVGDNCI